MDTQARYLWGTVIGFGLLSLLFSWSWVYKRVNTFAVGTAPQLAVNTEKPPTLPAIRPQDPRLGSTRNDALEVVEFADYRCIHCREMAPDLLARAQDPSRNVRLIWREAPTADTSRDNLLPFAAARCAHAQGKFAAMHMALFEVPSYTESSLVALAEQQGLDTRRFTACLQDEAIYAAIQRDQTIALQANITSAPTLFVRGKPYVGTLDAAQLDALLAQ